MLQNVWHFGESFWGTIFPGNFAKEGSVKKMVALRMFFLTPNQPADFKCSKQPIIYSDSTSLVEDLEHVHGGELQTRFEIELICGDSWCTSEDFPNNITWLISSLFFGPKVSRHPFISCLCYILFCLIFFWDGVAQPLSWVIMMFHISSLYHLGLRQFPRIRLNGSSGYLTFGWRLMIWRSYTWCGCFWK